MLERFNDVINFLKLERLVHNDSDFARLLGKGRSYISEIKNGKRTITPKFVEQIEEKFPQINGDWLLTGEGEMLKREEKEVSEAELDPNVYVPLLPVEAIGGELTGFDIDGIMPCDCEMVISPFERATHAIDVRGDSMYPVYPSGCRVFIRRVNEAIFIEWGAVHVVDTDGNGVVLKVITKADNDNEVLCLSLNPDPRYAPFTIEKQYIRSLWVVVGSAMISHF